MTVFKTTGNHDGWIICGSFKKYAWDPYEKTHMQRSEPYL